MSAGAVTGRHVPARALAAAASRCAVVRLRLLGLVLAAIAALACPLAAGAHKPSDAYLQLRVDGAAIEQRFDIALRDLERDLALDADDNGLLDWHEVRTRWADIEALAAQGAVLSADGRPCRPGPAGTPLLDDHSDGRYAVLTRHWTCPQPVQRLGVAYTLFALSDPSHRGIVRVQSGRGGSGEAAVLAPVGVPRLFAVGGAGAAAAGAVAGGAAPGAAGGWLAGFAGFVPEGIHHILIGSDHILFLLALLLPALLVRGRRDPVTAAAVGSTTPRPMARMPAAAVAPSMAVAGASASLLAATPANGARPGPPAGRPAKAGGGRTTVFAPGNWQPAPALRPVLVDVLRVVTAFTVAHSITLALAAFDLLNPPSRAVESVIAASVVLAALNNLFPVFREGRWKLTFVFGLVHGFGFASALKEIGLTEGALVGPLLGFNVGVELGQLAIVAIFIAAVWKLRATRFYVDGLLTVGSIAIALLALGWLVERAFDVKLPLPL